MLLSKKAAKEHNNKLAEQLKRMDKIALLAFFAIPLCLGIIGGGQLALWTLPAGYIYSIGYVIIFRRVSDRFTTKEWKTIARLTKSYPFHSVCWVLSIGFTLFFITVAFTVISGRS
ncbi:hypothetical protein [Yersinia kristensenii]|uniref:hypothetical protein n=1 Tax=Yersinia kristensenii TaxID=28152 RepID=UPI001C60890C|nr:hypothetical protein [Yersinia kristensenii]MBW5810784.1 hypothetical protein [Yersinia kristensenii]MBW5827785.1 hypothetical protein [Yersinia kristensenii]